MNQHSVRGHSVVFGHRVEAQCATESRERVPLLRKTITNNEDGHGGHDDEREHLNLVSGSLY
jgi:hypothetical protein